MSAKEWGVTEPSKPHAPDESTPDVDHSVSMASDSSVTPAEWTDCWRRTMLGAVMGTFVGVGAGVVDSFVKLKAKQSTGVLPRPWIETLTKTVASRGLAMFGFFTTYQTVLCLLRYKQLNKGSDISNVFLAGGAAFLPFMFAGRGNTFAPYFILLVAMDTYDSYREDNGDR